MAVGIDQARQQGGPLAVNAFRSCAGLDRMGLCVQPGYFTLLEFQPDEAYPLPMFHAVAVDVVHQGGSQTRN